MAGGWAKDGAVQDQIDASVEDTVKRARSEMARGESLVACEECGAAIPGVRHCIDCQEAAESRRQAHGGMNRQASKDSLLR